MQRKTFSNKCRTERRRQCYIPMTSKYLNWKKISQQSQRFVIYAQEIILIEIFTYLLVKCQQDILIQKCIDFLIFGLCECYAFKDEKKCKNIYKDSIPLHEWYRTKFNCPPFPPRITKCSPISNAAPWIRFSFSFLQQKIFSIFMHYSLYLP